MEEVKALFVSGWQRIKEELSKPKTLGADLFAYYKPIAAWSNSQTGNLKQFSRGRLLTKIQAAHIERIEGGPLVTKI